MRTTELLAKLMEERRMTRRELTRKYGEAWQEPMEHLYDLELVSETADGPLAAPHFYVRGWNGGSFAR